METHCSILPGECHGQRSLAGYSPRGRKESDTTEPLYFALALQAKSLPNEPPGKSKFNLQSLLIHCNILLRIC